MASTISKVANELGINVETIRFYERRGLIAQPVKPEIGYRHYPDTIVGRIRFIRHAQELGFTLDEIDSLLSLKDQPCSKVQALAKEKQKAVQKKLSDLNKLDQALEELLLQCHSNDDESRCPIIDSLQS